MNAKDVYREVSAMISQGHIESEGVFRASLNRALCEIGRLYPEKRVLTLRHFERPAVFRLSMPREVTKESPLTVNALSCKEIVFRGSGRGEVLLTFGGRLLYSEVLDGLPFSFKRTLASLGGDGEGELLLLFRTDTCMVLEELVLYDRVGVSEKETNGNYTVYRMIEALPSFISFSGECYKNRLPIAAGKELILDGDCILIDSDACGVYEIGCYAAPKAVTKENENEALDLSCELLFLVPLLTAYYAALEAEDIRTEDYLKRYAEARDLFRNSSRFAVNDTVEDVRGW